MGGYGEYFSKIAIYRPGIFVWDIPVTSSGILRFRKTKTITGENV